MAKKKHPKRSRSERLQSTCAFCRADLPNGTKAFAVGTAVGQFASNPPKPGDVVKVTLPDTGRTFLAMVPGVGSEAARAGLGLVYVTCDKACSDALRDELRAIIAAGLHFGIT